MKFFLQVMVVSVVGVTAAGRSPAIASEDMLSMADLPDAAAHSIIHSSRLAQSTDAIALPSDADEALDTKPDLAQVPPSRADSLELEPEILEDSPVLQEWIDDIPNVLEEIENDPSFRTRVRVGYFHTPDDDDPAGIAVRIEDVFLGRTGLTLNASYDDSLDGDRVSVGGDVRYYTLPLGGYVNVAPVVGYRALEIDDNSFDGVNLGLRLLFVPSRTGAADISLTQTWVNPGSDGSEVSLSTFSAGYALTRHLRLSSDIQIQVSPEDQTTSYGVFLEWML